MTPGESEFLSELTIIIPTYNRPLELERAIEYWRDTPVTVHILDGSEKPWFVEGCQPGTKSIFYHSFQPKDESPWENWGRRLKFGTNLMTTRFAALCCDDDVYTASGLSQALAMLNSGSFDAVAGKAGEYRIEGSSLKWVHKYPELKDEPAKSSLNIGERLMFRGGTQAFYGVFKSEKLRVIHEIGNSYSFPVPVWHEELITIVTRVSCRIGFISDLFWLKNSKNNAMARPIKFAPLFWEDSFLKHRENWLNGLSRALKVVDPTMSDEISFELISNFKGQFTKPRKYKKTVVRLKALLLRTISKLPEYARIVIFDGLPRGLKERIGNSNFEVNYKPVVLLTEGDLVNDSLKNWERILLMLREELRLRANM